MDTGTILVLVGFAALIALWMVLRMWADRTETRRKSRQFVAHRGGDLGGGREGFGDGGHSGGHGGD